MEESEIEQEWLVTRDPQSSWNILVYQDQNFILASNCSSRKGTESDTSSLCSHRNNSQHYKNNITATFPPIPKELTFTDDSLVSVMAYTLLFCLSAFCNLLVFITLVKSRHRKSRVNLFIMHLCIADMIVTFLMIPLEIGWHVTVSWKAGDVGCRLLMFFRAFGFYLSSFILITISLDRYFAIAHPLSLSDAGKRARVMLSLAWLMSACASIPQSVIFHTEHHPIYRWFTQCVTFNFFPSWGHELAYNLFNIAALYLAPLIVIVVSYTLILCEMTKKTRGNTDSFEKYEKSPQKKKAREGICESIKKDCVTLRRSAIGMGRIERARIRTLKMTIVIVGMFITCWTPYFVISAWWWIDKVSAAKINAKLQRALFLFAVSNSCVNPVIYGMFTNTFLREIKRLLSCKRKTRRRQLNHQPINVNSSSKFASLKGIRDIFKLKSKKNTIPLLQRQGTTNPTKTTSKKPKSIGEELMYTACAVVLPSNKENLVNGDPKGMTRVDTPPHISVGKGTKDSFEKYFLI